MVGEKKTFCNQALGRFEFGKGEIKCPRCGNFVTFEIFDSTKY